MLYHLFESVLGIFSRTHSDHIFRRFRHFGMAQPLLARPIEDAPALLVGYLAHPSVCSGKRFVGVAHLALNTGFVCNVYILVVNGMDGIRDSHNLFGHFGAWDSALRLFYKEDFLRFG